MTKKTGLAVLFAFAAATASCRRTEPAPPAAAAPVREPPPETSDVASRAQKRAEGKRSPVIWLGLDGLDWELLDGLAAAGRMPNWKRLTEEGYSARGGRALPRRRRGAAP